MATEGEASAGAAAHFDGGEHWLVDVASVAPEKLAGAAGRAALEALFEQVVEALALHPLGPVSTHTFDAADGTRGAGGSTALLALTESHLAAHGFPEAGTLCLDLFTCRPRPAADWTSLVCAVYGGCAVTVRHVTRGGACVGGRA